MLVEHLRYPVHYDRLNSVVEELDYPVTPSSIYVYLNIVGSCNGLLPIEFPTRSRKCLSTVYGFGYDSFADDYKLVRVVTFATERFETKVKLCFLGTNSWKQIEDFPYSVPNKSNGIVNVYYVMGFRPNKITCITHILVLHSYLYYAYIYLYRTHMPPI